MTSDDQQFLDLLASIPNDMATYGGRIADYIEKHTNALASEIRDVIDSATWLPESFKPPRNPNAHHFFSRPPPPPESIYEKTVAFISKNRTTIAVVIAFAGTTAYLIHRKKRAHARKRRAKKLPNGAKKEIVVLACSTFHDPLTRSVAVDLERRGYIVYVTVSSTEEDSLVQQEAKQDLRPLWMDVTSTVPNPGIDIHPNLEPIKELLVKSTSSSSNTQKSGQGSSLSNMNLAGIIVFPGCSGYPHGPLTMLHPADVVDSVNTRLLSPLITIQQFLPLLAHQSNNSDVLHSASIVIAYPSIPQSLTPPNEIPQAMIASSLSALASSLRREFLPTSSNIVVSELKLGNFDIGSAASKNPPRTSYSPERDLPLYSQPNNSDSQRTLTQTPHWHWHSSQRAAATRSRFGQSNLVKGSSVREFHNAVFDALAPPQTFKAFGWWEWSERKRGSTVFVGSGARIYDVVGKVVPGSVVGWMMGFRATNAQRSRFNWGSGMSSMTESGGPTKTDEETGRNISATRIPVQIAGASPSNVWATGSGSPSDRGAGESAMWEKV